MTRILGIDFGSKKIGLSLSDEARNFAFPLSVIKNSPDLIDVLKSICTENQVNLVVMGDSRNYDGKENVIMNEAKSIAKKINEKIGVNIVFHPEFLTSVQAEKLQGKNNMTDASAAAIILQNYLDSQKNA